MYWRWSIKSLHDTADDFFFCVLSLELEKIHIDNKPTSRYQDASQNSKHHKTHPQLCKGNSDSNSDTSDSRASSWLITPRCHDIGTLRGTPLFRCFEVGQGLIPEMRVRKQNRSKQGEREVNKTTTTTTTTPPPKHHHQDTTTKTPPPRHHHQDTTTKTPPPRHHHQDTTTKTPPPRHHHQDTTTKTPPPRHHHQDTTTKTAPPRHHHQDTTTTTTTTNNNNNNNDHQRQGQPQHHQQRRRRSTSTSSKIDNTHDHNHNQQFPGFLENNTNMWHRCDMLTNTSMS